MPRVPLELRIKVAIGVWLAYAFLWLASWLRFLNEALETGYATARVDRRLWLRAGVRAALDAAFLDGAASNYYPVRTIRAALKPYYPKERTRP